MPKITLEELQAHAEEMYLLYKDNAADQAPWALVLATCLTKSKDAGERVVESSPHQPFPKELLALMVETDFSSVREAILALINAYNLGKQGK